MSSKKPEVKPKEKISVSLDEDIITYLDDMVEDRTFSSRSHGIELCVDRYRKAKKNE